VNGRERFVSVTHQALVATQPLRHRRGHQIAEQHAEIFAIFRRLNHDDGEQGVARPHPKRGAHHTAPEELADAPCRRRLAGIGAHREAETEPVTGPEQKVASFDLGVEMVARHER
jgi:hypothetical protein